MFRSLISRVVRALGAHWHLANKVSRVELIQHTVEALNAESYLEIGVDDGHVFAAVRAPRKIGVDPIAPRPAVTAATQQPGAQYCQATSDDFFEHHAAAHLPTGVDVAFIDGLHTYEQTYRDIRNTLTVLRPGGVILVHDCLPATASAATVARNYDDAWRINGPDWNGDWTGDTWKSIVALRSGFLPVEACVLNCDHGVGVVYPSSRPAPLALSLPEIDALGYDDLAADPMTLLGLCRPAKLQTILRSLTRMSTQPSG